MKNSKTQSSGFTLIELIVSTGLFALVMLLSSGAYLLMIGLSRQAQGIATGIDNLSFAVESMARDIRTGSAYNCGGIGDCPPPSGAGSFSFKNASGASVSYGCSSSLGACSPSTPGALQETAGNTLSTLTDPLVDISSLTFYTVGTAKNDGQQSHVTIIVSGTVTYAAGKSEPFTIETGATMRGSDL